GSRKKIEELVEKYALSLEGIEIEDINEHPDTVTEFTHNYYEARKRSGATEYEARKNMITRGYYGSMMVKTGKADALLTGLSLKYPSAIKPIFEIIGRKEGVNKAAGVYIILTKDGPLFLADTTINTDPSVAD